MNPIFSGFMLPSLLWVRDNEPHNYEKIAYAMLPKDYIRYKLTGTIASEYSDASATLLFDIGKGEWSGELLDIFSIHPGILPKVYESTEIAGAVTGAAADATGLAPGTPLVYGGGDQIMQAIGNGVIADGMATVNIGSSGQVCFPSDEMKVNPAVTSNLFCGYRKNQWISMAATMSAGLSLAWWNNLVAPTDWKDLDAEVEKIPPGSGGLLFLPYLGGERSPHLNPDLSGSFVGLTHGTTHHKMTRAVMEGVTFALYDCVNICTEMGLKAEYMVASGGGANSAPWLKMQADIFNVPLKIAQNHEQAALGAAITAGVGCGVFKDIREGCDAMVRYKDRIIEPDAKNHETYLEYYGLFKAAFATQKDVIEKLTRLGR